MDDQVSSLIQRLEPHADRIASLAASLDAEEAGVTACLHIVRYFEAGDPAPEIEPNTPDSPDHLSGLGWHLDQRTIRFLAATGAALDVDEYGD